MFLKSQECDFRQRSFQFTLKIIIVQPMLILILILFLQDHNCVRELRSLIHQQQQKLGELKTEMSDQNITINELKRELQLFKDFMRAMRVSNPAMRAIADQMERDEVVRWSSTLARARVTRWGGMISTPDDALQMMIKRALSESGCPPHILDDLMENCHERRWPRGLSSLETRQNNRRIYDNYVCRRVPGIFYMIQYVKLFNNFKLMLICISRQTSGTSFNM